MKNDKCVELALVMNEWAVPEELKGVDAFEIRSILTVKLNQKLDRNEHTLPELSARDISGPTGGLCGMAFLYKALHDTVLTESQLISHSYESMKIVMLKEMNVDEKKATTETDFNILRMYYDFMCSKLRAKRSVDYQNYLLSETITLSKQKRKRSIIADQNIALYGNTLTYECGLGRKFLNPDLNIKYSQKNLTCNWNKTWTPENALDTCIWVACVNPPNPPKDSYLKLKWDGMPVNFSSSVKYYCDSDDKQRYLEHDRNALEYNLTCTNDGSWAVPEVWPRCLDTVTCTMPPDRPASGTWEWNGEFAYLTKVTYTCGPYGQFQTERGSILEVIVSTCMWNKSFVPDILPSCVATACPLIPNPPKFTRLEFFSELNNNFSLSSDNSFYSPVLPFELKFPENLCSSGYSLTIVGKLTSNSPGETADITFTTKNGDEALHVKIDLHENVVYRYYVREGVINKMEGAPGDGTTFDLNEIFMLNIGCDEDGWIVREDPKVPNYPYFLHQVPVKNVTAVELSGSMDISFVGFGDENLKPAPDVGFNITFACPPGKMYFRTLVAFRVLIGHFSFFL